MLCALGLAFLATAGTTGCGKEGRELEGSVTPLLDLHYERTEARIAEGELAVSFLAKQGGGENTVLKVSAAVEDMLPDDYTGSLDINLAELLENGAQRGTVGRSVLDEPSRDFPLLARGSLFVDRIPQPGSRVSGEFNVTFVNGTDVYSGRTIFGRFEATVP